MSRKHEIKIPVGKASTRISKKGSVGDDLDFLKMQYQVLSDCRINHNSLLWNMPSLLFVAQAFLWNIALDNGVNIGIRFAISFISILVGRIALHGFERNRLLEIADSEQLYSIELLFEDLNTNDHKSSALIIHNKLDERTRFNNGIPERLVNFIPKPSPLLQKPAFDLWKFMFRCIIGVAIIIGIYNFSLFLCTLWTQREHFAMLFDKIANFYCS